jgi:hypothetical protein
MLREILYFRLSVQAVANFTQFAWLPIHLIKTCHHHWALTLNLK